MQVSIKQITLFLLAFLPFSGISQEQSFPISAASFPKEVIPVDGGKIQISARFKDLSGVILNNEPFLFLITDGVSTYKLGFRNFFGLVGQAGDSYSVSSNFNDEGVDGFVRTYESLLATDQWHVFTLQWDKDGIPGIEDGSKKVAVYIDGIHRSSFWNEPAGSMSFPSITTGTLNLITQEAEGIVEPVVSVKDLVIYDRNNNIILQNTLASKDAIENSLVGPDGQFNGGGNAAFVYDDNLLSNVLTARPVFSSGIPTEPLILNCQSTILKQHNKSNYYHLGDLEISGLFSNIGFIISGATTRSGDGLNATGYFNPGTNTILWKGIDKDGSLQTCQCNMVISQPSDTDPAWTYPAPYKPDSLMLDGKLISGGDINGDGADDIVVYYWDAWIKDNTYDRRFGTARTFIGGADGLVPVPKKTKLEGFYGLGDYLPDFTMNFVGDVNGDGFSDLLAGNNFGQAVLLYLGTVNGISEKISWGYSDFLENPDILGYSVLGKNAGDVNGDSYSDVVLTGSPLFFSTVVFYGSSTGLNSTYDWIFTFPETEDYIQSGLRLGDLNNDGYDELGFLFGENSFSFFYGSASGLGNTPLWIQKFPSEYQKSYAYGGDLNGDDFYDLVVSGYSSTDSASYILYGTPSGLDTSGVKTSFLKNPSFVGDINGDGFDDLAAGGLIYYGWAKGVYPIPDALVLGLQIQVESAGDVNNDGFGDVMGRNAEEMQVYYGFPASKPYEEKIYLCGTRDMVYDLPDLYVNLSGADIKYLITGSTKRSGTGKDASGYFKNGTSSITWTVTDLNGKSYSISTTIIIDPYLEVQITDDYAVKPGGEPNTIYIGYGKQYLTLKSKVRGGSHKYSYLWSNGSTSSTIKVDPSIPGNYWYVLSVTDANNCKSVDSIKVIVVDVRCEKEVNKFLKNYLGGFANWKIIQDLVRERNFIKVCIPFKEKWISTCVSSNNVPSLLAKGAKLGICGLNSQLIVQNETVKDLKEEFSIKLSPNPSSVNFTLEVKGNTKEPLMIVIRNPLGGTIEKFYSPYSSTLVIGSNLKKGMYFVEVMQGKNRKVEGIIKL